MPEWVVVDLEGVVLVGSGETGRSEYGVGEAEALRFVGTGIRDMK